MLTQHQKIIETEKQWKSVTTLILRRQDEEGSKKCRKLERASHTSTTIARSIGRFYNIYIYIGIFLIRYIFLDLNITAVVITDIYYISTTYIYYYVIVIISVWMKNNRIYT